MGGMDSLDNLTSRNEVGKKQERKTAGGQGRKQQKQRNRLVSTGPWQIDLPLLRQATDRPWLNFGNCTLRFLRFLNSSGASHGPGRKDSHGSVPCQCALSSFSLPNQVDQSPPNPPSPSERSQCYSTSSTTNINMTDYSHTRHIYILLSTLIVVAFNPSAVQSDILVQLPPGLWWSRQSGSALQAQLTAAATAASCSRQKRL
jgi:hypothetical protein